VMWARHWRRIGHPEQWAAAYSWCSGSSEVHSFDCGPTQGTRRPDWVMSATALYKAVSDFWWASGRSPPGALGIGHHQAFDDPAGLAEPPVRHGPAQLAVGAFSGGAGLSC